MSGSEWWTPVPPVAELLFKLVTPARERCYVLGDLSEEYGRMMMAGSSRRVARRWYWQQLLGSVLPGIRRILKPRPPRRTPQKDRRLGSLLGALFGDIRQAFRFFSRKPVAAVAAIFTLGIGLGAVTAIYSVVSGVLLRPLPYDDPGALYLLEEKNQQDPGLSASYPNYVDWREQNEAFLDLAAFIDVEATLTGKGDPVQLAGWAVSAGLFPLLRMEAAMGRTFLEEEDRIGGEMVVLLSHRLWIEQFGGDTRVLGRSVTLSDRPWTVVGVLPPDFSFPPPSPRFNFSRSDFWVPLGRMASHWSQHRDLHPGITVLGRLKPDATATQARAEMERVALALEEAYPESNVGQRVSVQAAHDAVTEDVRDALWILLGAAGFLLLMACVNVASLQLARTTERRHELAVRTSLGARRRDLVRLVLAENVLLAVAGAGLGLALAHGAAMSYGFAAHTLGSRIEQIHIDLNVLAVALGLTLLTGLLSGLIPAWSAGSVRPINMLRGSRVGGSGTWHRRVHNTLMTTELAFALMLLIGAGLMIRSFSGLVQADLGVAPENTLSMQVSLSRRGAYTEGPRRNEFFHQLFDRARALPGVSAVGAIYPQPLSMSRNAVPYEVEGEPPPPPGELLMAEYSYVSRDYFRSVGASLFEGRFFEAQDVFQDRPVVIVDETFAQRHWPDMNPVGQRIKTAGWQTDVPWLEVVGVVGHIKIFGAAGESWVQMYVPFESVQPAEMAVLIRSDVGPLPQAADVRAVVRDLDANVPVSSIRGMESYIADTTASQRLWALILGVLSGASLLLAGTGVYGVVSYTVGQRSREIGLRVALGARVENVLGLVLREGFGMIALGIGIGTAVALAMSRFFSTLVFGLGTKDPASYLTGGVILLGVSLAALGLPALRAARLDPASVLKEE